MYDSVQEHVCKFTVKYNDSAKNMTDRFLIYAFPSNPFILLLTGVLLLFTTTCNIYVSFFYVSVDKWRRRNEAGAGLRLGGVVVGCSRWWEP